MSRKVIVFWEVVTKVIIEIVSHAVTAQSPETFLLELFEEGK